MPGHTTPPTSRRRRQVGNALIFAMLGLAVSGIAAVGVMQGNRLRAKHDAGAGEGSVLDAIRSATNNAIMEQLDTLQSGQPLAKNTVEVDPVDVNGELTWQPTIDDLKGMGYLPMGWYASKSTINNAPYTISFKRTPAGCVAAQCNIEGQVILSGALADGVAANGGPAADGAVIGPILTRLGADSGVSLATGPANITGYGNTWLLANPVPSQPPGVVAVRVGTSSAAFSQFVRIGDTRDPNLRGNMTVAGDTAFGTPGHNNTHVMNGQASVRDASGTECVSLDPSGTVAVKCAGAVTATTGTFADAGGGSSTLNGQGLVTTGTVNTQGGLVTPDVMAFGSGAPGSIVLRSGDLVIKDSSNNVLAKVSADGDVSARRNLVAPQQVQGGTLSLSAAVNEGDSCSPGQVALTSDAALATCQLGRYAVSGKFGTFGAQCAINGQTAIDRSSSQQLICHAGVWSGLGSMVGDRTFMGSIEVGDGDVIPESLARGCPAVVDTSHWIALAYLVPTIDVNRASNTAIERYTSYDSSRGGWVAYLRDGQNNPTTSRAIAEVYCSYR